jgi:hypothetical protein
MRLFTQICICHETMKQGKLHSSAPESLVCGTEAFPSGSVVTQSYHQNVGAAALVRLGWNQVVCSVLHFVSGGSALAWQEVQICPRHF